MYDIIIILKIIINYIKALKFKVNFIKMLNDFILKYIIDIIILYYIMIYY